MIGWISGLVNRLKLNISVVVTGGRITDSLNNESSVLNRTWLEYVMNDGMNHVGGRALHPLRSFVWRVGRLTALLTVAAVAISTTAAGLLVWWYATKSPTAVPSLAGVSPVTFLLVYGLLMVSPWWALLAVLFQKLNWLERPKRVETQPVRNVNHTRPKPAAG